MPGGVFGVGVRAGVSDGAGVTVNVAVGEREPVGVGAGGSVTVGVGVGAAPTQNLFDWQGRSSRHTRNSHSPAAKPEVGW